MEKYKPYNQKLIDYYQKIITNRYYGKLAIAWPGKITDDLSRDLINRFNNKEENNISEISSNKLFIESAIFWDNYICKAILENETLDKGNPLNKDIDKLIATYFQTISEHLEKQPLLFFKLPISKLPIELIKKYLPNIEELKIRYNQEIEKAHKIVCEIVNANSLESISEERVCELIKTLYYLSEYDLPNDISKKDHIYDMKEITTYFLLRSPKHYGIFENKFIAKFLAIKYCKKNNIDDININFVKFQSTGYDKDNKIQITEDHNTIGQNHGENRIVNINKYLLEKCHNTKQLLLLLCCTIFHELRHQRQALEAIEKQETDISYMYAAKKILDELDSTDYKRNYYHNEMEADADLNAILEIHETLNHFGLVKDINGLYTQEYSIALDMLIKAYLYTAANWKKDSQGKKYLSSSYINERLDLFFAKNPETLNDKYSQFQKFYNKDGSPKDLTTLLLQEYDRCDEFLLGQFISRAKNKQTIDNQVIKESSPEEKLLILSNYSRIIKACCEKIKRLSKIAIISKDQKTPIDKKDIDNYLDLIIPLSIRMYFQTAEAVVNAMQKHLNRYPELNDYGIENYIDETNDALSILFTTNIINSYGIIPNIKKPVKGDVKNEK